MNPDPRLKVSVSRLVDHWLSTMDADDSCDVLRLHPKHLRPIVAARCKRRARRKVGLKVGRECDPCVCGWAGGWHTECYWWFSRYTNQPATETFALPWRKSFQVNAEGMARELAALKPESTTDLNG
jgi:hypothetical protein